MVMKSFFMVKIVFRFFCHGGFAIRRDGVSGSVTRNDEEDYKSSPQTPTDYKSKGTNENTLAINSIMTIVFVSYDFLCRNSLPDCLLYRHLHVSNLIPYKQTFRFPLFPSLSNHGTTP